MIFVYFCIVGRLISIDYGKKRCGIAVTDPLQIVATPLATMSQGELLTWIKDYVARETVDAIIVGHPRDVHGNDSDSMRSITPALGRLRKELPGMEIIMWDERFTSVLAHRAMLDSGMRRSQRRDKEAVDRMAAVIILNSYLERRK